MPANQYHFQTTWRVEAPPEILYNILKDGQSYPRWWPDVYLAARLVRSGRADRIGDRLEFLTKGWLPYRLRWTAETGRLAPPETIEISATGDFIGSGTWHLEPEGKVTRITFDWRISAEKPLLRLLSPLLKLLFRWNHHWAMSTGLPRLRTEATQRLSSVIQ
jgi:uncharacterized protein YndB with AHSA1/START domain